MTGCADSLRLFEAGTLTLRHGMVVLKGTDEQITIPIPFFLIGHPDGDVLVDGGMQAEACADPGAYFGEHVLEVMKPRVAARQHVLSQLADAGEDVGAIRYVLQTHLHFDHTGAIGHLPDAEFVIDAAELAYARDPDWFVDGYLPADFERPGVRWRPIALTEDDPELDLYGDGAITLVHTPGHSPGLYAVAVRLRGGTVILAGDAADSLDHYRDRALPGLYVDGRALVRSVERLRAFESASAARLVIFGHDAEQWATLPKDAPLELPPG